MGGWVFRNSLGNRILVALNWMDVSENNGNLLTFCGYKAGIKVYDRRERNIVKKITDNKIGEGSQVAKIIVLL